MIDRPRLRTLIGGEFTDAADGRASDVINPATGRAYATAPVSGQADVDRAMRSAEHAHQHWRGSTPADRQLRLIWKLAPALAAGNTVVLKPPDTTPASTLLLAEFAAEDVHDEFVAALTERAEATKPGMPDAPDAAYGPLNNHPAGRRDAARGLEALRAWQGPLGLRPRGLHQGQARHDQPGQLTGVLRPQLA